MPNQPLYLLTGSTDGHAYIALASGVHNVTEYRIFTDRAGWFVGGEYYGIQAPPASKRIADLIEQHGRAPFLAVLTEGAPKWQLAELLGLGGHKK